MAALGGGGGVGLGLPLGFEFSADPGMQTQYLEM